MGTFQIGGLASGLDTDTLIRQLLTLERRPITVMEERQQTFTTKAAAWRDLNSRLRNLQNRIADLKNVSAEMWEAKRATVADTTVLAASASTAAQHGSYTVQVLALASGTTLVSGVMDAEAPRVDGTLKLVRASGGDDLEEIAVLATDTLQDVAAKINAKKDWGIAASVVQVSPGDYRLVLNGKVGADNDFHMEGDAAASLGLDTGSAQREATASNASIKVNNVPITVAGNSAKDAIPGVTLTLSKVGTTTVTVGDDHQRVVDAVKAFVEQYNSAVDFMEQQGKYDAKAKKSGTLFGESMVTSIVSKLSGLAMEPVGGLPRGFNIASAFGISSEPFVAGSTASRKLKLNESELRKALAENPTAVRDFFTANGEHKGLAVRMEAWLDSYTKTGGVISSRADSLDKESTRIKEHITRFDEQILPMKEKRLRAQFTALEKSLAMFQSQGDWLASQIANLGPWTMPKR